MFVSKAALWHQGGLSPWPPSLRLRCSPCEALASLIENNVDSARRNRRWWCHRLSLLVTTVPSSDAYVTLNGIWLIIPFNFSSNCNQLSQTTNWSMLIGGVVCCPLVQPNSTSETFSHALFRGRSSTFVDVPTNDFNSFVEVEGNSRACLSPPIATTWWTLA